MWSLLLKVLYDFSSSFFSAVKHLNSKKLQKLTVVSKVKKVLSGTYRKFKDRNHVMLKKLSDDECQSDKKN